MSNPTYRKVQEGAKLARENHADMILAVGGGSTMDCCKAVSLAARYDGDVWNDFWAQLGVIDFEPLPLGVVVTAAGTGSECNGGAVITNEAKKIKTGRDYPALNPRFALMDPTYTFSVPKKQMISGSFDILSHIMETYFSAPNEDNVSDDIMEALMRSVIRNLRAAIQNLEDYTARSNLMWDSTMAENRVIKMGKKCDFECHNMEHQLGAYTNCNHGCGLAVIHPVTTAMCTKRVCPSLSASPRMCGVLPAMEKPMRNWLWLALRLWPILSKKLACPLRSKSWVWTKLNLRKSQIPAVFPRAATSL